MRTASRRVSRTQITAPIQTAHAAKYRNLAHAKKRLEYTPDEIAFCGSGRKVIELSSSNRFEEALSVFSAEPDAAGACALIGMCGKMSGGLRSAFAAYETLKLASILPNAHVYTALVSACHKMGKAEDSLPLLDDMIQSEVMVNPVCFGIFAGASAACDDAIAAKKLLEVWKVQGLGNMQGTAIRGLKLVQAFNSRGDLDSIFEVFTLLDSHASKETGKGRKERLPPQLFTVMLDGCIKWKQYKRGLPLRQKMQEHNISLLDNDILFKCFLRICAATGDQPTTDYLAQALRQRDIKHTRTVINDKDCTQMLLAMMKADRINEGLEMFTWMNVNKLPVLTDQTFVVLLTGCADAVSLEQGQAVHQCLVTWKASEFAGPDKWLTTPDLVSALINMYAKCGQPARAESIFSEARRMCSGTTGLSV